MDLPTILAGPILRRVEPTQIVVWLALSGKYKVNAKLFHIDTKNYKTKYEMISDFTETETVRLGKNIYIYIVKIIPIKGIFPTQTLLGYNLFLSYGTITMDLNDFNLLNPDNPNSIVYGNLEYPSFFINGVPPTNRGITTLRKFQY